MKKFNSFRYLKRFLFVSSIIFTLNFHSFAQTYHDCTSIQAFDNFLEQNSSSEEILELMELEFAKSLSKFDKCVDDDYSEIKNKEDQNELDNSEKAENSREESTEQKEQENESSEKELAEQKEQENESSEKELAEQKSKTAIKELTEKKLQEFDRPKEKLEKVNDDYNNFSSNKNGKEFLNNKNNKIVDSVASSELSGTEINEENLEDSSAFENNFSEEREEYKNDQRFEQGEKINGMIPEDIPQDDNDSVLEEQIRLAAMSEKDPEKKKRLWNEYRKYKGLPKKE